MKCPNCLNDIDRNLSECPYCGNINLETFEMPVLKEEEINNYKNKKEEKKEIDINTNLNSEQEETNTNKEDFVLESDTEVKPLESPEATAEFDFTKEQETINPFSEEEENKETEEIGKVIIKDEQEDAEFAMKLPFRKKLISIVLFIVAVILIVSLVYFMINDPNAGKSDFDPNEVNNIITDYSNDNDNSKLDKILENINSEDTEKDVQTKTKEIMLKRINDELNKEYDNTTEFNKTVEQLKTTLSTIYNYRLKNKNYSLLNEDDYNELVNNIENMRISNARYFNGLELYESKEYDKAYKELSRISSANTYYNKSQKIKKSIITEILEVIKKDIEKVSGTELTEEKKTEIRELFKTYSELYPNVPLNTDEAYIALYNQYK